MAKKDLSHAPGLDALFSNSTTTTRQEPAFPEPVAKPVAKKKTPPKAKTVAKKVVKKSIVKEAPIVEEIEEREEMEMEEQVEKQQIRSRKTRSENKKQVFSVNLEGVRKRKIEYTGIRLKKELFDRLETIASKEKLKSTNSLIAIVLEAYCEGHES